MGWYIGGDGLPTNENFIECPEKSMDKPYPHALWRTGETHIGEDIYYNNGLPYNMLLPGITPYRNHFEKVFQREYITVHDYMSKEEDFDTNGLAVLSPVSCSISEEYNGDYSLQIELPIDDNGKWEYIREFNFIKAQGQIFRINQCERSYSGGKGTVKASAIHIFYELNDFWIRYFPYFWANLSGQLVLYQLYLEALRDHPVMENEVIHNFKFDSDITVKKDIGAAMWEKFTSGYGFTFTEAIMGENGLLAKCNGELRRDNFYFSVNERKYDYHSFSIYLGRDFKGIKVKLDSSSVCTHLEAYDNHGNMFGVSFDSAAVIYFPHNVNRKIYFDYDKSNIDVLINDAMQFWNENCQPIVSYTIDVVDFRSNRDAQGFSNIGQNEYKVGNVGTIYDPRLGINLNLKITKVVTDAITGNVKTIVFGSTKSFTGHTYNPIPVIPEEELYKKAYVQLKDKNGKLLFDKNHVKLVKKLEV